MRDKSFYKEKAEAIKNDVLEIPFNAAFFLAFSMASGTISTPVT